MTMYVKCDGQRQAPPLLCIHGSGFSGACWDPMVPALAEKHYVIRVDLPGCGRSPAAGSYDVPAQADRVAAVLDDLGIKNPAVAGHSSGGYVATALAERRPDLVRSLTLISTGPNLDAFRKQPLALRVLLSPPFGPVVWSMRSDARIRTAINATTARPVDVPDELIAGVQAISYRGMRAVLSHNSAYVAERNIPDRLAALDLEPLVIFGAADPRWDPDSAREYRGRIEMLPGVGHLPPLEAPMATSELLLGHTAA